MNVMTNAEIFLISVIFDFYIYILILRFWMQRSYISYYNPLAQLTVKLTNFFVVPLRRIMPSYKNWDFSLVFLMLLFQFIESFFLLFLQFSVAPHLKGLLLISMTACLAKCINLCFYILIFRVLGSWILSLQQNPIGEAVYLMTEPLLQPIRRRLPFIAGFDFSPVLLLIALQLLSLMLISPLLGVGIKLAY